MECERGKLGAVVSKSGNRDPWEEVYIVCMGKNDRVRLNGMKVGDRVTEGKCKCVDGEILLSRERGSDMGESG